jgi:ABC-type Zn uptake system ZnuABC Zn-binding protein ZnuA
MLPPTYNANAKRYSQEIQAIDRKLKSEIEVIARDRRFIVTCEGAFSYLAKDYGLTEVYLWPVNSERQATPGQVQKVIDVVRKHKIPETGSGRSWDKVWWCVLCRFSLRYMRPRAHVFNSHAI